MLNKIRHILGGKIRSHECFSTSWDFHFLNLCHVVAMKSKDPSTKVGAIIVGKNHEIISTGYNGFPIGVRDDKERYADRQVKYSYISHAEMNAISLAARNGNRTDGCSIYVDPLYPCDVCANLIIQSGIKEVIAFKIKDMDERWIASATIALDKFREAGVLFRTVNKDSPKNDLYNPGEHK